MGLAASLQLSQTDVDDAGGGTLGAVSSSTWLDSGVPYSTVSAPPAYGHYHFTHWTTDRHPTNDFRDAWGRAENPISFVLLEATTATAHYLPEDWDEDGDDLPDWFEIEYYGTLTNSPTYDGDDDGLTLSNEFANGTHPLYANTDQPGGVSRAESSPIFCNLAGYAEYVLRSDPAGTVSESEYVPPGTVVTSPDLSGNSAFGYWELDGVRQEDAWSVAYPQATFTVETNDREAVAYLFSGDEDGDGVPDAYEQYYLGTLARDETYDPDGDGVGLGDEFAAGSHPLFGNTNQPGGVFWEDSLLVEVNLGGYSRYALRSIPTGIVDESAIVSNGTVITSPNMEQPEFGYWTLDGTRQDDAWGIALRQIVFSVEGDNREGIAHLFSEDSDEDGVNDGIEYYFYGSLVHDEMSDTDGDGVLLPDDAHPVFAESTDPGGVFWQDSSLVTVNLQFFRIVDQAMRDGAPVALFSSSPPDLGELALAANSHPAVGDWDGDGDLDVFVGGSNGVMRVFENAGSPQVMNLVERTTNFSVMASMWAGITNPAPALGDWTGDGCADLAVGGETGGVRLVVSPGSFHGDRLTAVLPTEARESPVRSALVRASPLGRERGTYEAGESPVRSVPVRAYPSPRKIPPYGGTTNRYTKNPRANVRSAPVRAYPPPAYALTGTLQTNVHVGTSLSIPAFGDLDGDGWADLLVLGEDGRVRFSPHTQNPALPYAESPADADLLKSAVPDATGITTADVNEDGVVDVLISDDKGNVWEFHGDSP